jgi:subtilase family serine protease
MTWSTNHAGVHTIKVLQVTTDASTTSGASAATAAAQAASGATLTATGPLETGTVTTGNGNVIYSTTFQTAVYILKCNSKFHLFICICV